MSCEPVFGVPVFDIDVSVRRGGALVGAAFRTDARAVALVGPSGAGKTSLLMMVAGLVRPDRGHLRVGGRTLFDSAAGIDVPPAQRGLGVAFQDARLFPHRRVRGNLLYGARSAARLVAVADTLDIAPLLARWPRTLSGGEARRVAIGRALLSEPAALLLDEPTASLDSARAEEVLRCVERVRDAGMPVLMVTHDPAEAARIGQVVRL